MTGDTNPRSPTAATMQEEYIKTFHPVSEGQMVSGVVVEVGQEYIFVDIGLKSEGRIPAVEFKTPPKIGDRVYVILIKREGYGGAAIVGSSDAPLGLVSWWQAEDDATDSIDGNDGTMENGATFAAGRIGQAFSFDGNDDAVRVEASANLDRKSGG